MPWEHFLSCEFVCKYVIKYFKMQLLVLNVIIIIKHKLKIKHYHSDAYYNAIQFQ
jgi:hypothetical protein